MLCRSRVAVCVCWLFLVYGSVFGTIKDVGHVFIGFLPFFDQPNPTYSGESSMVSITREKIVHPLIMIWYFGSKLKWHIEPESIMHNSFVDLLSV